MALSLPEANRIVQAALAKAEELGIKISVAVCDFGGHLMAFNRMEGAIWVSAPVSQGKAVAAAGFGRASGTLPAESPLIQAVVAAAGGRMLPAQGGLPVYRNGDLIGSVGASGGTGEEDEVCAQAGLAVL
jgi:uncharacterized protein GlcG (DUF336 family)